MAYSVWYNFVINMKQRCCRLGISKLFCSRAT